MTAVCMTSVRCVGDLHGFPMVCPIGWRPKVPSTIGGDRRRVAFRDGRLMRDGRTMCVLVAVTGKEVKFGSEWAVPFASLEWMTPDGRRTMGRDVQPVKERRGKKGSRP